jgi:hypothetical protein
MVKPAGAMMVKRAGAYALSFLSTGTDACKARWVHPPAGPTSLMVRLPGPTGSTKLTGWLQDYARRNGERVHLWARTGTDLPLASAASGMRWPRCRVHSGIRRIGLLEDSKRVMPKYLSPAGPVEPKKFLKLPA